MGVYSKSLREFESNLGNLKNSFGIPVAALAPATPAIVGNRVSLGILEIA